MVDRLLGRKWHWGVAYRFTDWEDAVLWRFQRIPSRRGSFIADPFAIGHDGSHYIFVEEYLYAKRKGVISAYDVSSNQAKYLGIVLEKDTHVSFPYLFRYDGKLYMIPETGSEGQVQLYRCDRFPDQWVLEKVLLDGVAADTMVFEEGERWWLLTTIKGSELGTNDCELHAFHSDSPLGEWRPHALNPIVMDASKGRSGGLLRDRSGGLYRVGQRPAFVQYGRSFSIYRITSLAPDRYEEELVQQVEPEFFDGLTGTHHLHHADGLTVIDFLRRMRPH